MLFEAHRRLETTVLRPRARSRRRRALALLAGIVLGLAMAVAAMPLIREALEARGGASAYRYRFERASRGSVVRGLEAEIAFYQERIRRDPEGGLDLAALASAYLRMGRATGDLSWYLLAEQAARRSLGHLPFSNNGAVLMLARLAEARHDFREALRLAAQADGKEDALAIAVTSHLALGQLEEASRAAERLLALAPTMGGYTLRALVHEARGEEAEALDAFHRAIAAEEPGEAGGSAAARTYLGRLHARRGRLAQAEALYGEALRILPQHPLTLIHLAELELRRGRTAAAERHLAQVVTITEASPTIFDHAVLHGLARARALAGDAGAAEARWAEAERRLRRDVAASAFGHRRELARLLLERGRPREVAEALALMRAEAQSRRDAETLDLLAWALARAGRWTEAQAVMRGLLATGVRSASYFTRAGMIEQALGHPEAADRFFDAARQTDPTFDEHARRLAGLSPMEGGR